MKVGICKCRGKIKKSVLDTIATWLGKSRRQQEIHGIHRKWSVKWINEGSGRMSTMKKEKIQKTEGRSEKSHIQGQHRISRIRMLWLKVHADRGTKMEVK